MANIRQYIGARYTIKIYENSQDASSAEWEQGNFEPLIMVTWQNGSYLSKKDVPASVGNPADNPTYWVQTGFYNGQIASLQQQIDEINNTLNTIIPDIGLNRKVICIGDSYLGGSSRAYAEGDSWGAKLRDLLNNGTDTIIKGAGNSGFIGQPSASSHTFILQLQEAASDLTTDEKANITDIIAIGALNDMYGLDYSLYNVNDITAAIHTFCQYAHTTFPNATIRIGIAAWTTAGLGNKENWGALLHCYKKCATGSAPNKVQYMSGLEYIMPTIPDSGYYDTVHPNADTSLLIARGVFNCMMGGNGNMGQSVSMPQINFTYENGATEHAKNVSYSIYDNIATVKFDTLWLRWSSLQSYPIHGKMLLGEVAEGVPIRASKGVKIPANIWYSILGGANGYAEGYLWLENKKLYMFVNINVADITFDDLYIRCSGYSDSVFNLC